MDLKNANIIEYIVESSKEHLENGGVNSQDYLTHCRFACMNSAILIYGGVIGIIHGLLPFLFKFTTSSIVIEVDEKTHRFRVDIKRKSRTSCELRSFKAHELINKKGFMRICLFFFVCLILSLGYACDRIPEEGTIVYDVDFPPADSCEASNTCDDGGSSSGGSGSGSGSGSGGGSGGSGNGTTGSGSGSGGHDPDNSSIGYTIVESGDSTDVIEGATDDFTIVLNSQPTDNITITVTTPNTGDILISSGGGSLSADNTTLTLTFTPLNWNTPQSVTVTGVEDATDEGGGTTAVNLTVSLTASLDTNWVPADIPDSTITANLTDSQATGPPSRITNLSAVAGVQKNTLSWTAAPTAANHILYWSTSSPVTTSADNFTLSGTATSYVHSGLTAGTPYYYMIVPINGLGSASPSNEVSGTPSSFTGCTTSGHSN